MDITPARRSEIRQAILPLVRFGVATELPAEVSLGNIDDNISAKIVFGPAEAEADPPADPPAPDGEGGTE